MAQLPVIDPNATGEARRLATICNACRYCEGVCAVFPALELRRAFTDGDMRYLANLCHGCGACYYDCQFSPPHEFQVHLPRALARVRVESYQHYAWPSSFAVAFERHALVIGVLVAVSVAAFILVMGGAAGAAAVAGESAGFYRAMPHGVMAGLFGAAFAFACLSIGIGAARFHGELARSETPAMAGAGFWSATADSGRLRYLEGGGVGCMSHDERPSDRRRLFHHFTFYGFMLCFASTVVAAGYHYLLGLEAPYDWLSMPVILGTLGGSGLVIGTTGLMVTRVRRDPELRLDHQSLDVAFVVLLWATAVSGLLLLVARATAAMPLLLAVHLGVVFALFISLPYGKFVHGIYRFIALRRYAAERAALTAGPAGEA